MSSTKHIVWITPGFASSEEEDSCIPTLLDFLSYIQKTKQVRISIIALQYPYTSEKYQVMGADVYPLNGQNKWYKKISVWNRSMRTLAALHAEEPIDIIHSFWLGATALIGQAFSAQRKITHICTLMGQDVLKENRHLRNKRLKDLTTIALSTYQAEIYFKNTGRRVKEIIPFAVEQEVDFSPKKKYDIIGVGSLIPVKNYEMWIEIIKRVKEKMPGVKALLVGDGEEKADLIYLIEKNHLESSIELAGQQKRKDVLKFMDDSRVFLHTSKHEGQGYVFFEAMSKRLPILSTPVGYSIENEKIWKGIDPQAFADEIVHLLRNPDFRVQYRFPDARDTFKKYWDYYKR